ncbi:MAG: DUF1289 domain-containing protein [Gammaproteobacteria bacterium]
MNRPQELLASPCIGICRLEQNRLCVGCFRTIDEITGWAQSDTATRTAILLKSEQRRHHFLMTEQ